MKDHDLPPLELNKYLLIVPPLRVTAWVDESSDHGFKLS
jgi:hypothetical protein